MTCRLYVCYSPSQSIGWQNVPSGSRLRSSRQASVLSGIVRFKGLEVLPRALPNQGQQLSLVKQVLA